MAWFAAAIPYISAASTGLAAAQTIQQARTTKRTAEYNARLTEAERKADADANARAEESLRRENRSLFGRQRAAMAEAGIGPGGTTGLLADQSAALAELDALNMRYQGSLRGTGLLSQARATRYGGRAATQGSGLLAGAQLLSGASDSYKLYRQLQ